MYCKLPTALSLPKKVILVSILYNALMIFYTLLPNVMVMVLTFGVIVYFFHEFMKKYRLIETLYYCSLIVMPTSFVSVLGTAYSELPLSWFQIFVLLMVLYIGFQERINRQYLFLTLCFVGFVALELHKANNIGNALSQAIMIIFFLLSFIIGECLKKFCAINTYLNACRIYIAGSFSLALQIIMQSVVVSVTGTIIGRYDVYAERKAIGGLMGDYSFASIYLASGALLLFIFFIKNQGVQLGHLILFELAHLYALILTTARTGLYALILTVGVFMTYDVVKKRKINIKIVASLLLSIMLVPMVFGKLLENRGGQSLLDGSGRFQSYVSSLGRIQKHLFFGIGFGLDNLTKITGEVVPHNFFIQYLLQFGVIGTMLIVFHFFIFVRKDMKKAGIAKWMFVMVAVSSMAIPDIVSSRILYGIVTMIMVSNSLL